ncbi:serine/threonine protein phosphatase [Chitinophaga silvatica]|uniref:Serine/threonine protein phosphatase n=1 Tax=Chitinophaga silvatica TaxID=2282649 RepID=A0A3E1YCH4_9BACT|nr:metallophosphoesterase family protein [Chitinophaga silvatica]RFS23930.1 serine/threonine protein phosphatase [Chitinophaga silvatica]
MKTFVIGDIHGAFKALQQLLVRMQLQPEDQLIFLGDYVDGWPQSAQVIELLIELQCRYRCIFIKGNHDVHCELWLQNNRNNSTWAQNKGLPTIQSYEPLNNENRLKHLEFFSRLQFFHIDANDRLFLHAGFKNDNGPAAESPVENLTLDRSLWELALTMNKRVISHPALYPKRLKLFKEIYIGHTPTLIYNETIPMSACNVWNIDTGAGHTGCLSAMDIDSKEVIQSDIVQELYPEFRRYRE